MTETEELGSEELDFRPGYHGQITVDPKALAQTSPDQGLHNFRLRDLFNYQIQGDTYRNQSTIMAVPAISNPLCTEQDGRPIIPVPPRVAQSWLCLQTPANQKFTRAMVENCKVDDAYNQIVSLILNDPELSTWKYMLTVETDNIPPPDGLLQIIEDIERSKFDAVGGLYWAKGPGGTPMCYGKPDEIPRMYRPWVPPPDAVSECNGLGMGFTLFKIDMFRHINPPWFRTVQEWVPGIGERQQTQDLYFFNQAAMHGYRFGCSTNVRVGHIDADGVVW